MLEGGRDGGKHKHLLLIANLLNDGGGGGRNTVPALYDVGMGVIVLWPMGAKGLHRGLNGFARVSSVTFATQIGSSSEDGFINRITLLL